MYFIVPSIPSVISVDGLNRNLDEIGPAIYTNKTTTYLNCAAGSMFVDIEFKDPFFGIIYPNGSRQSACFTHGSGEKKYHLELPLKGCGTTRIERRVFLNNIIVRFHKEFELKGDEVKTIICRYPSPEVLLPPIPAPIILPEATISPAPKHVGEIEILLIICGILFLALLLVGMACSYTCLKKRNIRLVRRRPLSLGPPSTLSKMSGSILIEGLKIPRATVTSTSGSDTALVSQSETLPSDYPSESPSSGSEVEEGDVHSLERVSVREEIQAFENTAFEIEDRLSSVYSDGMIQSDAEMVAAHQMVRPPQPTFMVRVKRPATPPKTPEPDYPIQLANSQSLTTIFERDESFRAESLPGSEHALMLSEAGDLEPPALLHPPVKYSQVSKRSQHIPQPPPPPPSDYNIQRIENVETIVKETTDVVEMEQRTARRLHAPRPISEPELDYASEVRSVTDVVEATAVMPRQPVRTMHTVDDRHLSTITETHVVEDVERHKRYVKQYHVRPKPPKWNVAIRHYQAPKYADEMESSGPEWEAYSEPGSDVFRRQLYQGADSDTERPEMLEHPPPPNWNVLLRVLQPPETQTAERCVLTDEDRDKWYQILHTESTLRTMLTRATVREDYERIRYDQRYEKLFEPQKWDVIIRILTPPMHVGPRGDTSSEAPSASDTESLPSRDGRKYRKHDLAGAIKKTSLPPVHEYSPDSHTRPAPSRSRRSSKSSLVSGADVRSITETEVNFARAETSSEASGPSGARSTADRSHSEITYAPGLMPGDRDYPDTDYDDRLSAKTARSLARSTSEFTEDWRHHEEPSDRYSESSGASGRHRQAERSVSEYMEEAPHFSDVATSPDASPQSGRRYYTQEHRYHQSSEQYQGPQGSRVQQNVVRVVQTQQGRTQYRTDRAVTSKEHAERSKLPSSQSRLLP
ncbi:hypothetical protein HAZT_HAZT005209 [Hyalella azteca]|uniref:ZP domain-containing protein n=1 Tax=Hyalella azteca TaxID=294128 RepID=A0A6A0GR47_HYAAZ|nr:hypothetical protein HAZT_HAZT005209 [Hyalella azteca]